MTVATQLFTGFANAEFVMIRLRRATILLRDRSTLAGEISIMICNP